MEVAEALDKLGFGKIEQTTNESRNYKTLIDENGMSVIIYDDQDDYITDIVTENGETVLWEWEYTDKYEIETLIEIYGEEYKSGFEAVFIGDTEKNVVETNANELSKYIFNSAQAEEVAEALSNIGFSMCVKTHNDLYRLQIMDETGMIVNLKYKDSTIPRHSYFSSIVAEDGETILWKQE